MQMDNYYYALRLENGTVIRVATQARSVYSVFLAASPFVMLILILIVSILYCPGTFFDQTIAASD